MEKKSVSLADMNLTKQCEQGFEFEYLDETFKPTGIFFTVIGGHSEKIKRATFAAYDRNARMEAMQKKRGKEVELKSLEEQADENLEITAMRVVAWRGITEPCTPENVLLLMKTNVLVVRQVLEASENISNFTRSK